MSDGSVPSRDEGLGHEGKLAGGVSGASEALVDRAASDGDAAARREEAAADLSPLNVAAWLSRRAALAPDALAVAVARSSGYHKLTAAELDARCDRVARALATAGIGRGTRTVVMVTPSLDFFAVTFALFKLGAVMVMVDPGMGVKNLGRCLGEAEPEAFIGIPKAHVARCLLGWARGSLKTLVTVGRKFGWGGVTLASLEAGVPTDGQGAVASVSAVEPERDETAAILFTSGSTGVPKGVLYPHRVFAAQVQSLRDTFGIEPGEVDLSTFPLFALFGPALGMASVVPLMDASRPGRADPARLVAALNDFQCTSMFASPALVEKVSRYCHEQKLTLSSLRRAISAGAPANSASLERFALCLPDGVQVWTPYGATESMPVTSIGSDEILEDTRSATDAGAGVCVGQAVAGIELAVIALSDEPIAEWCDAEILPTGKIGEIVVKGPVVTESYWRRDEHTALAKMRDDDGRSVRHRMGDVGWLDERGRLWMCGRKNHRVIADGRTMFTVPCEAIFNTHPAVFRTALVGAERDGAVSAVLCVQREQGRSRQLDREALIAELLALGAAHDHTRLIETVLFHDSFPVDVRHNAKIFREQLAVWASKQL
ncbi:MAG: acyl-CoA synthetase (AMP-forming)/AMP-acid ligase II, partial [Pseudohongiellaceae bacterium]